MMLMLIKTLCLLKMLISLMRVKILKLLQEVALERLVAALVEEKGGGLANDLDDGLVLEGTELNQTCVLVGPSGDKKHPERLV